MTHFLLYLSSHEDCTYSEENTNSHLLKVANIATIRKINFPNKDQINLLIAKFKPFILFIIRFYYVITEQHTITV
jgi:hypothetical protein